MKSGCDNCTWIGEPDLTLTDIPDLLERIEPGGIVPSGECPKCGALCYLPVEVKPKTEITLTEFQKTKLLKLLWDSMKRDPEHKDRKQTGWGTKTQFGLIACIERIINEE